MAAIILLIFLNSFGWLNLPKNIFLGISMPILKPFQFLGSQLAGVVKIAGGFKDLIIENKELEQRNHDLILENSKLQEIKQENKILREQLQIRPPLASKMVMADLVGFDPSNLGQYFYINRGRQDGILPEQAVIFGGGFLVGKVIESSDNLAKVMLLTDGDSSIFAVTQETRVGGVAKGDHGVGIIMDMVPADKDIKIGETVISSGLDGFIPRGLVIGEIESRISSESEVFQKFKIKLLLNLKEIETVFIILGNQ